MSNALVDIKAKLRNELATLKDSVPAVTGHSISVTGKIFKLPDGETSPGPLECVILDWRNFNRWYPPGSEYNAQNPKPPACFAIHKDIPSMEPHDTAPEPQADSCVTCKHNEWGSDRRGGRGKDCENRVTLAIVPVGATEDSDVYTLGLSRTALKYWSKYINGLAGMDKHPMEVVTQLSFDPNQSYPTVRFKPGPAHDKLELFAALAEKANVVLDAPPVVG
jgi:hypothetical protein